MFSQVNIQPLTPRKSSCTRNESFITGGASYRKEIDFFTLNNLYIAGPTVANKVDFKIIRHRSNSDTDSNHNSLWSSSRNWRNLE
ncbi:hypothetical protein PIROE2DRAFT_1711 [Piromyces sp. E2]|nr:hypothetical protein PIROE2DRAFT_1711 [Piromyces sp. E2]|eukprot:OUM70287.1 hypothetical protein PIROE2DRAFT_1711 [Piromyces sp. E2]